MSMNFSKLVGLCGLGFGILNVGLVYADKLSASVTANTPRVSLDKPKTIGILVFPGFETLDVFGPVEMFGSIPDKFKIVMIGTKPGTIKSYQGISIKVDTDMAHAPRTDILMIPGGQGVRTEILDPKVVNWIQKRSKASELTLSVCTGAALLAKAGVLDGHKATTNKQVFSWVESQGPKVTWIKKARWVDDGNIITSSGVSAGIDMSLYVIDKLYGEDTLKYVETYTEYNFNDDSANDKFEVK